MAVNIKPVIKVFPWKSFLIFYYLFSIVTINAAFSTENIYYLKCKNISEVIECKKLQLRGDSFRCSNRALFIYATSMVETVTYNDAVIYPYDRTIKLTEKDLFEKDCDYLLNNVSGPLLLEESDEIMAFVGSMYEHGICADKSTDTAFQYYQKAGQLGRKKFYALQDKLERQKPKPKIKKAVIDPQTLITLQKDSDIKRMQKEMHSKICSNDCEQTKEVRDKYTIEPKCYSDCMKHYGY